MNRAIESPWRGGHAGRIETERFGVSHQGFTSQDRRSTQTEAFSPLVSSSALLRRPRARREVKQVQKLFVTLQKREEGQTMAEYGVVLAVITALVFGALSLLSGNIISAITRVAGYIS